MCVPMARNFVLPLALTGLLIGAGCSDSTGGFPDVSGLYDLRDDVKAAVCVPQTPPSGGTVILDAFVAAYKVRIEQTGSNVKFIDVDFPDDGSPTGTIDAQGNISTTLVTDFQEDPRAGNRTFFDHLTITENLQREKSGATVQLAGTSSIINVFHEGTIAAPVFATCNRTSTPVYTRIGD